MGPARNGRLRSAGHGLAGKGMDTADARMQEDAECAQGSSAAYAMIYIINTGRENMI